MNQHDPIKERCPECHLPLFNGYERHWVGLTEPQPTYRKHRCPARTQLSTIQKPYQIRAREQLRGSRKEKQ